MHTALKTMLKPMLIHARQYNTIKFRVRRMPVAPKTVYNQLWKRRKQVSLKFSLKCLQADVTTSDGRPCNQVLAVATGYTRSAIVESRVSGRVASADVDDECQPRSPATS